MDTIPHGPLRTAKPTPEQAACKRLYRKIAKVRFYTDERGWKKKVSLELNELMGRAVWTLETDGRLVDQEFAKATVSICRRVAEFEGIDEVTI